MAIEIKELVIRAIVTRNDITDKIRGDNEEDVENENSNETLDRDEIIAECVDQVLKIIRREQER